MVYYYFSDIVPKGVYICVMCNIELHMNEGEALDLCPVCSSSKYYQNI